MSSDFDDFIASQKVNNLDDTAKQYEQAAGKRAPREVDQRFWNPATSVGKDGTGRAIVRFLPVGGKGKSPFVTLFKHSYTKSTGGQKRYYIENSRKTIGLPDPVYDYNGKIMDSTSDKDQRKKLMIPRQQRYIANIIVLENDVAPEQVGNVYLWDFGGQIWEKIDAKMFPDSEKDKKYDPFNIFEGMNLIVRTYKKQVGENLLPQYDKSEFEAQSPIGKDPVKTFTKLFEKVVQLEEFLDPKNFKDYDVLEKQLNFVLGKTNGAPTGETSEAVKPKESKAEVDDSIPFDLEAPADAEAKPAAKQPVADDDDDSFFDKFK